MCLTSPTLPRREHTHTRTHTAVSRYKQVLHNVGIDVVSNAYVERANGHGTANDFGD